MVGVPHSTGCALCRERRIKCDEAIPQCSQCRKYGRPCPGYRRTFRFQDEGPALQRRHQSRSQSRRSPETTTDAAAAAAAVRNNALAMMRQTRSEDSFSSQAQAHLQHQMQLQMQQPHLFASFLHSAFPTLYTSNIFRAHNRPDFLAHVASSYASGEAPYLAATLACLTSIYTAQFSPDSAQHTRHSRQLYAQALTHVAAALHSPAALSAPLLATIMMLAVYEMYARTSPDAFVVHVDGHRQRRRRPRLRARLLHRLPRIPRRNSHLRGARVLPGRGAVAAVCGTDPRRGCAQGGAAGEGGGCV
ncbi:hypothetical protein CNMCM5623_007085 [Aspergillus felis]|uniref:Zn(2)-C6 fungal-type domain-containing protein n=1 Tax=Aspergillus felis TaxID=1287682 RepID=A0A8H6QM78_9EURO|nr:hypothetical protein CNMCM5623_007085 [Aspergillus felis]